MNNERNSGVLACRPGGDSSPPEEALDPALDRLSVELPPPGRAVAFVPGDLASLARAFHLLEAGRSVCLCAKPGEAVPPPPATGQPMLGVYSSGSTGLPKLRWRRWLELKTEARVTEANRGWRWASPFSGRSFAGVQVAVQAWRAGTQAISLPTNFPEAGAMLAAGDVDALSCTPTFLDLLIRHDATQLASWHPRQITLGGEPLRPRAAEAFRKAFPKTEFRLIYASAEFGVLLKTTRLDGWFEIAGLEKRYPDWKIEQGELHLWHEAQWKPTGDLVELSDGRIRVFGRVDAVANVGGAKVSLGEVERTAEEFPGVWQARAFAVENQVTGEVVGLRVTPENGWDAATLQAKMEPWLHARLPKPAWPRRWEFAEPALGPNTKEALA